jgi:hypothetical protein
MGIAAVGAASLFPRSSASAAETDAIRPFRIDVPEQDLVDLRRRLAATRWPEKETVADESQGVPLAKIAVGVMLVSAAAISTFVERHPTVKMLALSFLLLIGMSLIGEGFGQHIPKGYIYFAMGFSVFVEMINLRLRRRVEPVHLKERYISESDSH